MFFYREILRQLMTSVEVNRDLPLGWKSQMLSWFLSNLILHDEVDDVLVKKHNKMFRSRLLQALNGRVNLEDFQTFERVMVEDVKIIEDGFDYLKKFVPEAQVDDVPSDIPSKIWHCIAYETY